MCNNESANVLLTAALVVVGLCCWVGLSELIGDIILDTCKHKLFDIYERLNLT